MTGHAKSLCLAVEPWTTGLLEPELTEYVATEPGSTGVERLQPGQNSYFDAQAAWSAPGAGLAKEGESDPAARRWHGPAELREGLTAPSQWRNTP